MFLRVSGGKLESLIKGRKDTVFQMGKQTMVSLICWLEMWKECIQERRLVESGKMCCFWEVDVIYC